MARLDKLNVLEFIPRDRLFEIARERGHLAAPAEGAITHAHLVVLLSDGQRVDDVLSRLSTEELAQICRGRDIPCDARDHAAMLAALHEHTNVAATEQGTRVAPVKDLSLYRVLALLDDDTLGDIAAEFGFGSEQASEDRAGLVGDMIESGLVSLQALLEALPVSVLRFVARHQGVPATCTERVAIIAALLHDVALPQPAPVRAHEVAHNSHHAEARRKSRAVSGDSAAGATGSEARPKRR